ncbi:MAG TPA: aminotransferase, partial [Gammaproteobacteria bacterium]|nr:aminotransferase [Gammaproteobacteria bacterium]
MLHDDSQEALKAREKELQQRYETASRAGLSLDMTRGKPAPEQLDLADRLLTLPGAKRFCDQENNDCRNYGGIDGLTAMKKLFADILGCQHTDVIVGGNSSLTMMHDAVSRAMLFGVPGGDKPWGQQ